jgi:hypothetical protein
MGVTQFDPKPFYGTKPNLADSFGGFSEAIANLLP